METKKTYSRILQ